MIFFEFAQTQNSSVLVRASSDREINKKSRYSTQDKQKKICGVVESFWCAGKIVVEVSGRDNKPARTAHLEVRFGQFMMHPSRNNVRHKTEKLPNLTLYATLVIEINVPS